MLTNSSKKILVLSLSAIFVCICGFIVNEKSAAFNDQQPANYVGALHGSFKVNTSGAAIYSVPISVPPSAHNIIPKLTINYTSSSGNGLLGMGFSMSGLSSIKRVSATIAQDGFIGSVNYDSLDRFTLNGIRLINTKGKYGAHETVYHTETESWQKVISYGKDCGSGPCWFKVLTKKGYVMEFGNSPNSQIPSTNGNGIRIWTLHKITDLNGNYLLIDYQYDSTNGSYYPIEINYTGNEKTGLVPQRKVQFTYEDREDIITTYQAGGHIRNTKRLVKIATYLGTENVLNYNLSYQYSPTSGRSQLKSISECDQAGKCLPATVFSWQKGDEALFDEHLVLSEQIKEGQLLPLDLNGDGLIDFANLNRVGTETNPTQITTYLSDGDKFTKPKSIQFNNKGESFFAVDQNGDGRGDVIKVYLNNQLTVNTYLSSGNKLNNQALVYQGPKDVNYGIASQSFLRPTDANGDGRTDLIHAIVKVFNDSSNLQITNFLANGKSYQAQKTQHLTVRQGSGNLSLNDVNGDGMNDLTYISTDSKANEFQITTLISDQGNSYFIDSQERFPLHKGTGGQVINSDVNGDGLGDIIYGFLQDSLYLSSYFSTAKGFVSVNQSHPNPGQGWLMNMSINGDNLKDLAFVKSSSTDNFTFTTFLSAGNSFLPGKTISSKGIPAGQRPIPMDINGDAKTDFLLSQSISGNIPQFKFTKILAAKPFPDMINKIENGIGGTIKIKYKPLTDKQIYQQASNDKADSYSLNSITNRVSGATYAFGQTSNTQGATFPVVNVTLPIYVVAKYIKEDGRGAFYPYSYRYQGARVDRNGRGWLGFQTRTMIDSLAKQRNNTHFKQLFPLSGKTDSTTTFTLDGQLMTRNRSAYEVKKLKQGNGNTLYQVNQSESRSDQYEYGDFTYTLGKNFKYDEFGNTTEIINLGNTSNENNLYTFSTFENDTSQWRLGYLTTIFKTSDRKGRDTLSFERIKYDESNKNVLRTENWVKARQFIDSTYIYNPYGNITQSIDQAGDTISLVYDEAFHSFPIKRISPRNQLGKTLIHTYDYNPYFGNIKSITDPNGHSIKTLYDGLGRAIELKGPDPSGKMITLVTYAYKLQPETGYSTFRSMRMDWKEKKWQVTEKFYDGIIRNYKTTIRGQDDQLVIQQKVFNSEDRLTDYSMPYFQNSTIFWKHFQYDPYQRIIETSIPKGEKDSIISKSTYKGNSITVTHAEGTPDQTKIELKYDYFNDKRRYVEKTNEDGFTTRIQYDPLGRIIEVTDPGMIKSKIWYDGISRRKKIQDASRGISYYLHDDLNRIYQVVNEKKDTTTSQMDALGRRVLHKNTSGESFQYLYDLEEYSNSIGRLSQVIMGPDFHYAYTYDNSGNSDTTYTLLNGKSYSEVRNYNPNHILSELIFDDQSVQRFHYNEQALLSAISLTDSGNPAAGSQTFAEYKKYDARGDNLMTQYGNGTGGLYSYNPLGKILHYELMDADGKSLLNKDYTWNDAMQITRIEDLGDPAFSQEFSYDAAGRLLTANGIYGPKTYQYDASGNISLKDEINFQHNNYQVILGTKENSSLDTVFKASYDLVGNRTSKTAMENGKQVAYKYTYDARNQLKTVEKDGGMFYSFKYDFSGRRVQKINFINNIISDYVTPNYEITRFPDSTIYTKNIKGRHGLIATVSHTDATSLSKKTTPIAGIPTSGVLYLHQDHVGNTKLTTSEKGILESIIIYEPYGKIYAPVSNGPNNFRYKFGGKELDNGSGLYYFDARYYDPQTGSFITADTNLGSHPWKNDLLNRYAYGLNNPIKNNDPSGHSVKGDILMGLNIAVTLVAQTVLAVVTEGAAIPEEVALDAGLVAVEVGADGVAGATALGASEAATEGGIAELGEDGVDAATNSLSDCDCGQVNEEGESMCFIAGTLVASGEGHKVIEEVKTGDLVWAWNEATKTKELKTVTSTSKRMAEKLVEIQFGQTKITATPEHPFYVNGNWMPAAHIKEGDTLYTLNKKVILIEKTSKINKAASVYNLVIDGLHNYGVSDAEVLVHNPNGNCNNPEDVKNDPNNNNNTLGDDSDDDVFRYSNDREEGGNREIRKEIRDKNGFEEVIRRNNGAGGEIRINSRLSVLSNNRTVIWLSINSEDEDRLDRDGLEFVLFYMIANYSDAEYIGFVRGLPSGFQSVWQPLELMEITENDVSEDMIGKATLGGLVVKDRATTMQYAREAAEALGWVFE